MWDSRTPHGNYPNQSNGFRIVQYTGMFPVPNEDPYSIEIRKSDMANIIRFCPLPIQISELGKKVLGLEDFPEEEKSLQTIINTDSPFNREQCGY